MSMITPIKSVLVGSLSQLLLIGYLKKMYLCVDVVTMIDNNQLHCLKDIFIFYQVYNATTPIFRMTHKRLLTFPSQRLSDGGWISYTSCKHCSARGCHCVCLPCQVNIWGKGARKGESQNTLQNIQNLKFNYHVLESVSTGK